MHYLPCLFFLINTCKRLALFK